MCSDLRWVDEPQTVLFYLRHSKGQISKQLWMEVFHRAKQKIKQIYHFTLPLALTFYYPAGTKMLHVIQHEVKQLISTLPFSTAIIRWFLFILRWVPLSGPTVKSSLDPGLLRHDSAYLQDLSHSPCLCHHFPGPWPKVDGCIMIRGEPNISKFFGPKWSTVVLQNAKNVLPEKTICAD